VTDWDNPAAWYDVLNPWGRCWPAAGHHDGQHRRQLVDRVEHPPWPDRPPPSRCRRWLRNAPVPPARTGTRRLSHGTG